MTKKQQVAEETFKWCLKKFGNPLKTKTPSLIVNHDRRFKKNCGEYYERILTIYTNVCTTNTLVIKTVIHEYRHFLQMPRKGDMSKYEKMALRYNYNENPLEIDAFSFEKLNYTKCKKYLKRKGVI